MTKRELLLNLAKDCVNWSEGADFEMAELLHETDGQTGAAIEKYYSEFYNEDKNDENWVSKEGYYSEKFYDKVQKDITEVLKELIEQAKG